MEAIIVPQYHSKERLFWKASPLHCLQTDVRRLGLMGNQIIAESYNNFSMSSERNLNCDAISLHACEQAL